MAFWEVKSTPKADIFVIEVTTKKGKKPARLGVIAGSVQGALIEISSYIRQGDTVKTPEGLTVCLKEEGYPNN